MQDSLPAQDWLADCVERLRSRRPRVHCITNTAAQAFTANVLLAAGAIPSLTIAEAEVAHFAGRADALLINLGTFDPARQTASAIAVAAAIEAGRPWVLDPVLIDMSPPRRQLAAELLDRHPAIMRCNPAEFTALADAEPDDGAVAAFARDHRTVVAITGEVDRLTDGSRRASVTNGHPLMARITAAGCALGALMAAFAAVEDDAYRAALAALVLIGVAGSTAGTRAAGPGSFAVGLIDALATLSPAQIALQAEIR